MSETRTARLSLPQWSAGTDGPSRADFNEAFNNLEVWTALDGNGLRSARPDAAASNRGMYYHATDTDIFYRSTGATWKTVGANVDVTSVLTVPNATDIPLVVQGAASQTADLQTWQTSSGTVLAEVRSDGSVRTSTIARVDNSGPLLSLTASQIEATGGGTGQVKFAVRGSSGQTANLQNWISSTGSVLAAMGSGGRFSVADRLIVGSATTPIGLANLSIYALQAADTPIIARGFSGQTGDLTQWQSSAGAILASIGASGAITGARLNVGLADGGAIVSVSPGTTSQVGLLVRGLSGQSADLQQWQLSGGAVAAHIDSAGSFYQDSGGFYLRGNGTLTMDAPGTNIIEIGRVDGTASSPRIDFHSSGGTEDYNARISVTGGISGTIATADLNLTAGNVVLSPERGSTFVDGAPDNATAGTYPDIVRFRADAGALPAGLSTTVARFDNRGHLGVGAVPGTGLQAVIGPDQPTTVGLRISAAAGQSVDMQQWVVSGQTTAAVQSDNSFFAPGGYFGRNLGASTASGYTAIVAPAKTTDVGLMVRNISSGSGNMLELQNSSNVPLSWFTSAGYLRVAPGSVTLAGTGAGFQIGPSTGVNLVMDGNQFQALNNGAAATLYINTNGGAVAIGSAATSGSYPINFSSAGAFTYTAPTALQTYGIYGGGFDVRGPGTVNVTAGRILLNAPNGSIYLQPGDDSGYTGAAATADGSLFIRNKGAGTMWTFTQDGRLASAAGSFLHLGSTSAQIAPATGGGLGDKIGLFSNNYGLGIQTGRLVTYVASSGALAVRASVTDGSAAASSGTDGHLLYADGRATHLGTLTVGSATDVDPLGILFRGGAVSHQIEFGRRDGTASVPYIDWHSGASTGIDYDARLYAQGGDATGGSSGGGSLVALGSTFYVQGSRSTVTPMVVRGAASQTGALIDFQNSSGTLSYASLGSTGVLTLTDAAGSARGTNIIDWNGMSFSRSGPSYISQTNSGGTLVIQSHNGTNPTQKMAFGPDANGPYVSAGLSTGWTFAARAIASQSGNLMEWQNSGGVALSYVTATGSLQVGAGFFADSSTSGTTLTLTSKANINVVPLTVKGQGGQVADMTQWQNSGATPIAVVTAAGEFASGSGTLAAVFGGGATNHRIELGRTDGTASNPYIDFHSGTFATDYDTRLYASGGGTSTSDYGKGQLLFQGSRFQVLPNKSDDVGFVVTQTNATVNIASRSITSNVATVTTSTAHGFTRGRNVSIAGDNATFNGTYLILTTPTTTTFTFAKTNADVANAAPAAGATATSSVHTVNPWSMNDGQGQGMVAGDPNGILYAKAGRFEPTAGRPDETVVTFKGAPSQTGDLSQWYTSSNGVLAAVSALGRWSFGDGTVGMGLDTSQYAPVGVTRVADNTNNLPYFGMTKAGTTVFAIGITKDNKFVIGSASTGQTISTANTYLTVGPTGATIIKVNNPAAAPLQLFIAASQTTDAFQVRDSADTTTLAAIDANGLIRSSTGVQFYDGNHQINTTAGKRLTMSAYYGIELRGGRLTTAVTPAGATTGTSGDAGVYIFAPSDTKQALNVVGNSATQQADLAAFFNVTESFNRFRITPSGRASLGGWYDVISAIDTTFGVSGYSTGSAVSVFQGNGFVATITNYSSDASGNATITTSAAHGFVIGNAVEIRNLATGFNGFYYVTATPTTTTFTYNRGVNTAVGSTVAPGTAVAQGNRQSGDLTQWRDGSGRVVSAMGRSGELSIYSGANAQWSTFLNHGNLNSIVEIVRGAGGQTADLTQWQNSAGTAIGVFGADGSLTLQTSPNNNRLRFVSTGAAQYIQHDTSLVFAAYGSNVARASITNTGYGTFNGLTTTADSSISRKGVATSTTTVQNSYGLFFGTNYWNGTTAVDTAFYLQGTVDSPTGLKYLQLFQADYFIANASVYAQATGTNRNSLVVRASAGQTVNMAEFQNSAGTATVLSIGTDGALAGSGPIYFDPDFTTQTNGKFRIRPATAGEIALNIAGRPSQSGDLLRFQNSGGSTLASVGSTGAITTPQVGAGPLGIYYTAALAVSSVAAASPVVGIRAAASQTGNLTEWLNSGGGLMTSVDGSGRVLISNVGSSYELRLTASDATATPNKHLRVSTSGAFEIVNSAFTTTIFSLSDTGAAQAPSFTSTSTRDSKTDVQPLTVASQGRSASGEKPMVERVKSLAAVSYTPVSGGDRLHSFIAEEAIKHLPEIVSLDQEGKPSGINLTSLGTVTLALVQHLLTRIDSLESKIKEMSK